MKCAKCYPEEKDSIVLCGKHAIGLDTVHSPNEHTCNMEEVGITGFTWKAEEYINLLQCSVCKKVELK